MNGAHQLLIYVDDVNILAENINTIKTNAVALLEASREVGPEINRVYGCVSSPNCKKKS